MPLAMTGHVVTQKDTMPNIGRQVTEYMNKNYQGSEIQVE
jgi:hypothetical protein